MLPIPTFRSVGHRRIGLIALLFLLLIGVSTLTRLFLLIISFSGVDATILNLLGIFFFGLLFDIVNALYFSVPLVLYLWLMPNRIFMKQWHRFVLYALFFIFSVILVFNSAAEYFFWDEFSSRFNFIAVDYLVYTTEVIGNIQQSYPVEMIIAGVVILSAGIVIAMSNRIREASTIAVPFRKRSLAAGGYVVCFVLFFFAFDSAYHRFSNNAFVNELSGNGMYELFAAYRNNELDYDRFYKGVQQEKAFKELHELMQTREASFISRNGADIERKIVNEGPEKRMNIVLISVESFSADFMGTFGNTGGYTPFLDSIAKHSLLFTNLYATGTRTVRGLEALSLCVPPTPGQSIVRRPNNEHLFSLGKVFKDKGYSTEYIYGGYGYFDNMSYFFSNNSYEVVDRTALKDEEIDYENIWGVADENLFTLAAKQMALSTKDKPVFAHVMTTSNHRPFTYPEGRIDIPSHTSREGAVKYTDYSIGKFIKQASREKWFSNTIFIIVADHCASSAGKTELPIEKYHIPMIIYSPGNIEAGTMDRLMSQIDIGPTLLGMLNFSYTSKFYGYDMAELEPGRERVFISTYQNLGYITDNKLIILSPQLKVEAYSLTPKLERGQPIQDAEAVEEAIVWYQTASYAFRHGLMK